MLSYFERFLASVPLSEGPLGFTELVVRAVDSTETPIEEYDLRGAVMRWDLWIRDVENAGWKKSAERLTIFCNGLQYDGGVFAESGHFMADLGFEHLFTGHAGLLSTESVHVAEPEHPDEARFLMWMSQPKNLREYQEKTRENIQKLMRWMGAVEQTMPVERVRLWSEGEENFEARLDEILAVP
jgi:hypothetical protein